MKKTNIKAILILCALFAPLAVHAEDAVRLERTDALVVCRSKQCKPANSIMTKEFLYNKLAALLKSNVNQRVLLCDANPNTYTCINDAITFDAMVGASPAEITLPSLYLLDSKPMNDLTSIDFVADYEFKVADTYPECQAALNNLTVACIDEIFTETAGFDCHFTANGTTTVNAAYNIDYIDLDYGIIGATYTIGVSEASQGGTAGYALLRFARSANDENLLVNCGCGCVETQTPPCQCKTEAPQADKKENVEEVKTGKKPEEPVKAIQETKTQKTKETKTQEQQTVIVKEKVITQYKVAPVEVVVRTKAVSFDQMPQVKVNGVQVPTEQVKTQPKDAKPQILSPNVPVIMEVEEI